MILREIELRERNSLNYDYGGGIVPWIINRGNYGNENLTPTQRLLYEPFDLFSNYKRKI